jgi:hypothetical protein
MRIKDWNNYIKSVVSQIESLFECRAVKFYLVMPHPSPLLKEKELFRALR